MRTAEDGARDQDIGPTLTIEGQDVTNCRRFLARLPAKFKTVFERVRAHDEQILRSGHTYKIAYFVAPLSNTQDTLSLPPSPLVQLLGAERVMERYTADDHLRHGLARSVTGTNWYLLLVPVNTGFLGIHGVQATQLVGPDLHGPSTAGVIGLSLSTSDALDTADALTGIPVFTTATTGDFMRRATNIWLSQTMHSDNASVLLNAALRKGGRAALTVITDDSDGANADPIPASAPCPKAHTPITLRYSTNLTQDLVSAIKAQHVKASCVDYRALEPLSQSSPWRCAGLPAGTMISALRGWALGEFMDVLNHCRKRFTIVSAEGATNLTETGQETLRDVWRRGPSLIYLGYQVTGSYHRERGEQAEATGADAARASFTFPLGSRQATSPTGTKRPTALCTVVDVNQSGIIDHCEAAT